MGLDGAADRQAEAHGVGPGRVDRLEEAVPPPRQTTSAGVIPVTEPPTLSGRPPAHAQRATLIAEPSMKAVLSQQPQRAGLSILWLSDVASKLSLTFLPARETPPRMGAKGCGEAAAVKRR